LGIPVVAVVDTNCDPTEVDYVIPGNDDALRAIRLFTSKISESIAEGAQLMSDKQIIDMSAATETAQAAEAAPEQYDGADMEAEAQGDHAGIDVEEDISMEDVMSGRGAHKKPVANEDANVHKVESQTV
jgi:small subunit ribosomal protein S2